MFRRVRFECGACGEGFVDWHDEEWERAPVFCVNCGEPIEAGAPVDSTASDEREAPRAPNQAASALGVLKSSGEGFRDTLPGLRVAGDSAASSEAPESSRDAGPATRSATPGPFAKANSTAPRANASLWAARRRRLAPLGALLVGFALGVPLTLVAQEPISRLIDPAAFANAQLTQQLAAVSTAIDNGSLGQARASLERCLTQAPASDRRLATLRARLALGLILANHPAEASRELAALQKLPHVHPAADELQRVYDAAFAAKPSSVAANAPPPVPKAPPAAPKALVNQTRIARFCARPPTAFTARRRAAAVRGDPALSPARCRSALRPSRSAVTARQRH